MLGIQDPGSLHKNELRLIRDHATDHHSVEAYTSRPAIYRWLSRRCHSEQLTEKLFKITLPIGLLSHVEKRLAEKGSKIKLTLYDRLPAGDFIAAKPQARYVNPAVSIFDHSPEPTFRPLSEPLFRWQQLTLELVKKYDRSTVQLAECHGRRTLIRLLSDSFTGRILVVGANAAASQYASNGQFVDSTFQRIPPGRVFCCGLAGASRFAAERFDLLIGHDLLKLSARTREGLLSIKVRNTLLLQSLNVTSILADGSLARRRFLAEYFGPVRLLDDTPQDQPSKYHRELSLDQYTPAFIERAFGNL